jgi:hypothetical protein
MKEGSGYGKDAVQFCADKHVTVVLVLLFLQPVNKMTFSSAEGSASTRLGMAGKCAVCGAHRDVGTNFCPQSVGNTTLRRLCGDPERVCGRGWCSLFKFSGVLISCCQVWQELEHHLRVITVSSFDSIFYNPAPSLSVLLPTGREPTLIVARVIARHQFSIAASARYLTLQLFDFHL